MHPSDFEGFSTLLHRQAVVFGKELSDELVAAYWEALKDLTLTTVTELATQHARFKKFFPKPAELRPKDSGPPLSLNTEGHERAVRNLDALAAQDHDEWRRRVYLGHLDRQIATIHEGDLIYPAVLAAWRRARGIHVGESER